MDLLTPLALLGLLVLPLLVLLHLRRRRYRLEDVSSTLLWRELLDERPHKATWMRLHSLPLLLLQLLAVSLLVLGLARPVAPASSTATHAYHVYVLDDSLRMAATDVRPNRLAAARAIVDRSVAAERPGTTMAVVVAAAQPYLLLSSANRTQVERALATLAPTAAPADLGAALRLADGWLPPGQNATITLLHANEDAVPAVVGATGTLSAVAIGRSTDNQAILRFSARCAPTGGTCTAFADIRNEDDRPVNDPLVILGDGDLLGTRSLVLPARADVDLSFLVPRGRHVLQLHLVRPDVLALDNTAWCLVGAPARTEVTVVGEAAGVAEIRRALASLPGVTVRVRSSARYTPADAATSDLLILDGWRPPGALPPAPAVLLVNPPSLPGGQVNGMLADATVSGQDTASPLLSGVDLTSLDVPAGTAEQLTVPAWVAPVVWSAAGPLLAAGDDGAQRLAVLAFDPTASNLPQLAAFPTLLWNVVRWATAWLPSAVAAGTDVLVTPAPGTTTVAVADQGGRRVSSLSLASARAVAFMAAQPGLYTVTASGQWGSRSGQVAANVDEETSSAQPVLLARAGQSGGAAVAAASQPWWPWIGLAALLVIAAEWLYVARRRER